MRGMGRIYQRGPIWWIAYYFNGEQKRESSNSERESDAKRLLKRRLGETGKGKLIGPVAEKVTFEDLVSDLITDYQINKKRSLRSVDLSVRHLRKFFGMDRAIQISADRIRLYIASRQADGASNGSINRELSALGRAFSLSVRAEKLASRPYIPRLEENNARQGFVDHAGFMALKVNLPGHLQDPVQFLYLSGWRVSEMKSLEWRDVDLTGKVVRLRPEVSKNKDGRILPLTGELLEVAERAKAARRLDCPYVFHLDGEPIGDFRKSWRNACRAVGLKCLVHDFRRTAVRNMIRAGIPDKIAMDLSGHRTRAIFDRYNITSESDLARATERLQAHLLDQAATAAVCSIKKVG
jgi:integrase